MSNVVEWTCWETGEVVEDWDTYNDYDRTARVTVLRENGVDYVGVDYLRFDWNEGYETWTTMQLFYPATIVSV